MFLLPKGNPLYENIPVARVKLPEMLAKLKEAGFTGYVIFTFPSATTILFFEGGKLVSAMHERGSAKQTGFEAMAGLCGLIVAGNGSANVYRLSKDLIMGLHALLHGEMLYRAQELKLIDIKGLLEKVKTDRLNGCLRIYTEERSALIFYKDGAPLGFFHDGSQDIETSATESQKIAGLPGAKIDVLSTKSADELMHYDLMEMVNIGKLWDQTTARHAAEVEEMRKAAREREQREVQARLAELEEDLKEISTAYLGKMGRTMVEKELVERGGRDCLLREGDVALFLSGMERGAKLLTGMSRLKEMVETMKGEIEARTRV